ncbi:MAG: RNA polymerase factor sigma-54 [Fimbriimonadales bacterium]|nr:RNA polymerase factor sigma-54 [Fimbriimonadales bacterium]
MRHPWHQASLRTGTELRVDPRVILSSQILQLSSVELESAIQNELEENPALERLEESESPLSEQSVLESLLPEAALPCSQDWEFRRSLPTEEGVDWLDYVCTEDSLGDHLRAQLAQLVPEALWPVADYMVDCLDERGYLDVPVEEVALATGCTLEQAEEVHRLLRSCDPPGVGATDLVDCLLLQLRGDTTEEGRLARAILKNHVEELASREVGKLARRYRVSPEAVEAAFARILSLDPFPVDGTPLTVGAKRPKASPAARPDLTIRLRDHGWEVLVHGPEPSMFTISRSYSNRLQQLREGSRGQREEVRHVGEFVKRARNFIESLGQRCKPLNRIGRYLVERQPGFLATGRYQYLQPLTRTRMAHDLGLHESTVSRATMGKFVEIATGEVLPFDVFFKPALRVRKMIEEILATENPRRPLSDERIAELLAQKGVKIARRTVSKYRQGERMLSSHHRRSA